jgi:hypothetical protein
MHIILNSKINVLVSNYRHRSHVGVYDSVSVYGIRTPFHSPTIVLHIVHSLRPYVLSLATDQGHHKNGTEHPLQSSGGRFKRKKWNRIVQTSQHLAKVQIRSVYSEFLPNLIYSWSLYALGLYTRYSTLSLLQLRLYFCQYIHT